MIEIIWDLDDDPAGNVQHCTEHGVTQDEVAHVLDHYLHLTVASRSSDNWVTFGYTAEARYLAVVWQEVE